MDEGNHDRQGLDSTGRGAMLRRWGRTTIKTSWGTPITVSPSSSQTYTLLSPLRLSVATSLPPHDERQA